MPNNRIVFTATLGELAEVPGTPFAYWAPKSLRDLFQKFPPLDRDVARQPDKPKIADVKQGLATADDLRFTRYWWEVPIEQIATSREETFRGKKWVPWDNEAYLSFFRGRFQTVVNWENNGEEIRNFERAVIRNESFYFRPGLVWTVGVSRSQWERVSELMRIPVRCIPSGCIFGVSSQGIFPPPDQRWWFLGVLVSQLVFFASRLLADPGRMPGTGHCAKLPVHTPTDEHKNQIGILGREAYDLLSEWSTGDEASYHFIEPWLLGVLRHVAGSWSEDRATPTIGHPLAKDFRWSEWESAERILAVALDAVSTSQLSLRELAKVCVERERVLRERVEEIQRQIDQEVYQLYGISNEDRSLIEVQMGRPTEIGTEEESEESERDQTGEEAISYELMPAEEHIKRLVHYLAHEVLKEDPDGIVPLYDTYTADSRLERGLTHRVRERLREIFSEAALATVEQDLREALGRSLDDWLSREFFGYHLGLYRLRPIIWQIVSRPRGQPAFGCFLYWHKLDADTLRKVQEVYLRPALESARRQTERLATQLTEQQAAGASLRALREVERAWRQAEERHNELHHLGEQIQDLLRPYRLSVQSRSAWVPEKVNEVVAEGFHPNRDYGVRVNIEPLKQAEIVPAAASRVKG